MICTRKYGIAQRVYSGGSVKLVIETTKEIKIIDEKLEKRLHADKKLDFFFEQAAVLWLKSPRSQTSIKSTLWKSVPIVTLVYDCFAEE